MSGPAFNSIGWFEIGTDQPDKVKEFYRGGTSAYMCRVTSPSRSDPAKCR